MEKLTRRQALRLGIVGGFVAASAALLSACGGSSTAPPSPPVSTSAPVAGAPTQPPAAPSQSAASTVVPALLPAVSPGATASAAVPGPELVVKPPRSPSPITLRFNMRSGGEKSEPAIYVDRPREWSEATGDKVKLEPTPGGTDYIPKIEALAASNTLGDLVFTSEGYLEHSQLVRFNVLEPMDSYLQTYKVSKDEWFKAIVDGMTYNGKMYGLPKTGYPPDAYIWINLQMFKDAGIAEPPTYGNTFDDIREWANKLSKGPKDSREVYGYSTANTGIWPVTQGVRQFGSDLIAKDGLTSLVDQQGFADWLNWNYQLVVKDKVHPLAQALPSGGTAPMFAAERVAMVHEDRSFLFGARAAVQNKFPFTSIQYPRGPKALPWGTDINTHSVTASSKYKDEAFSLSYALADRRFAYLVGKTQGYLTGRVDNLEDLGPYANDHFIQLQYKCETQEGPFWRAKNLRAYEIQTTLNNTLDLIWLGKREPDQSFIGDLKKALDEVLSKPA
ncbi:MAG: extracellular solute-binding protein [Chloroflexota bacterium]